MLKQKTRSGTGILRGSGSARAPQDEVVPGIENSFRSGPGASPATVNHIVVFNFYNIDISK
jgi:hypothetical protein